MIFPLDGTSPDSPFPPADLAEKEPDGLLAVGGDLSTTRLLNAYKAGIFPWFSKGQPILWWSPNPRFILQPEELHVSRSLKKTLRKQLFDVTFDMDFEQVIRKCAATPRKDQRGTWILSDMISAYIRLHQDGHAHSVEVWKNGEIVGGLYGVAIGRVFFGESMFALVSDASKVGFATLVRQLAKWEYAVIDCQVETEHLKTLGAKAIPREVFLQRTRDACKQVINHQWRVN